MVSDKENIASEYPLEVHKAGLSHRPHCYLCALHESEVMINKKPAFYPAIDQKQPRVVAASYMKYWWH